MLKATDAQIEYIKETTPPEPSSTRTVLCHDARERRAQAAARFHDYDRLVWAVGIAVAVAVIASIASVTIQQTEIGIAGLLGAIVGGAAVAFLLNRRNEAKAEEKQAWEEVEEHCEGEVVHLERSARVAQRLGS
jgi:hypothetical protein